MSIICVSKRNGIACIASDTLATYGATKESAKYISNCSKIIKLPESIVAAVGHASVTLNLQVFLEEHDYTFKSIRDIRTMARELHTFLKDECFLNPHEEDRPYETSRIHLLIASAYGIFGLYDLRSVQEYTRFYAFGSGDNYALGAMHALFDGGLTSEEISRAGARAACEFDECCGEPIDVESIACR